MGDLQKKCRAFTVKHAGRVAQLCTEIDVLCGDSSFKAKALWDTGANGSCISHDVVKALNLTPIGRQRINTPSGESIRNTFLVDFVLPNNVTVKNIVVCDSDIGRQGLGVLLGMDIITFGDFAVSTFNGQTAFSFRVPSQQVTDYVVQENVKTIIGPKHGKGTRKRK